MRRIKCLLVGNIYELTIAPASALLEAGFEIDVLCPEFKGNRSDFFRSISTTSRTLVVDADRSVCSGQYDLVVIGDDKFLGEVLNSNLSSLNKLNLLPVTSIDGFKHLYSKCALSELLRASNILTPKFLICHNPQEVLQGVDAISYPIFVKIDSSGGGDGVFECKNYADLSNVFPRLTYPILLQEKIEGITVDLSAFYLGGKLVHFSYSIFHKSISGKYGPSSVRKYFQIGSLNEDIYEDLNRLGCSLMANGFMNITCIEEFKTGNRYFIEADMRPNAWFNYDRFIGSNAANSLKNAFLRGHTLRFPQEINPHYPLSRVIALADRLKLWEVIFNRYSVWRNFQNFRSLYEHIRFRVDFTLRRFCFNHFSPYAPKYLTVTAHNLYNHIFSMSNSDNFSYRLWVYRVDLLIRVFFSRYFKAYIPKSIWLFLASTYRYFFHQK